MAYGGAKMSGKPFSGGNSRGSHGQGQKAGGDGDFSNPRSKGAFGKPRNPGAMKAGSHGPPDSGAPGGSGHGNS